ncbi:hypothetical protein ABTW72_19455 [Micromonospora sp. NPDC127501]|uniref:hypothetical protein n=1 Tax=Micromonospora sp. NPDC127501 TaxID=3154872 RepID=UPI00331B0955
MRRPVRKPRARRRGRDEPLRWTEKVHALSSLVTLVVALPALVVAGVTYRDQQEINRAQLESTRLEFERYKQRFASRVAVWMTNATPPGQSPASLTLRVQNRSPVPVRWMRFDLRYQIGATEMSSGSYEAGGDAPPCSLMTFKIDIVGSPPSTSFLQLNLVFTDVVGGWELGSWGLRAGRPDSMSRDRQAVEIPEQRETVGDCGEGN